MQNPELPPHLALQKLIADTLFVLNEQIDNKTSFLSTPSTCDYFKSPCAPKIPVNKPVKQVIGENLQVFKPIPPKKSPLPAVSSDPAIPIPDLPVTKEKSSVLKSPDSAFQLEPMTTTPMDPMKELEQLVKKAAPELSLAAGIPDDAHAKRISSIWREQSLSAEVVILFFQDSAADIQFLKNLAKAIEIHLAPTRLMDAIHLENEKKWKLFLNHDALKLILASPQNVLKYPELKKQYRELPHSSEFFLEKVPFLPLSPFSSYFKNPLLKRALWQKLCQMLKR